MAQKKYVSLSKLSTFLDNLFGTFASLSHKHTISDISDYTVDTTLSSTSTNPVQNKVIDAEFDAMVEAMGALETAIDGKADASHTHDDRYYTETEIDTKISNVNTSISNITNGTTIVAKATQDASGNTITSTYETKTDATAKLNEAKSYADSVKSDLLNGAGGAYDTLKELGDLIDENTDAIDALETVAAGKADKTHTHTISDVTDLQEATISTAGLLSAEDKIQLDYGGIPIASTSGTGAAYTAVVNGMTSLTVGMSFMMIPHTVSTSTAPTLNVNNLGAKTIRRRVSNATQSTAAGYNASWLSANKPIMVTYDGMFWIADILKPSAADVSGTMGVSNGGTGKNSITAGNFLVGNGTSAMTEKTPAEALTHMGITATATEINYMDGVTSNVQTQIDSLSSEIADLKTTEPWTFTLEDGSTTTKLVYVSTLATENWTFTLEDGSTVTKGVCVK